MPFYDINFIGSPGYAFVSTLPEYLRPKLGVGLTAEQLQVYEDFPSAPQATAPPAGAAGAGAGGNFGYQSPETLRAGNVAPAGQLPQATAAGAGGEVPLEQAAKRMDQFVLELLNALSLLQGVRSLSELSQEHVVVRMFSRVPTILMSTPNKYELAVYTAQLVFPKLFERILLHREAFLTIIDALVSAVPTIRPKITELLIFSDPTQKFHHEVVPALLHYNMLSISDYDVELADLIAQRNPMAVEFATFLYQSMIKAMALSPSDLILTLETLLKLSPADAELRGLVESVRGPQFSEQYAGAEYPAGAYPGAAATGQTGYAESKPTQQHRYDSDIFPRSIPAALERQVVLLFNEWLTIHKINDVKTIINFMRQLQQATGFYASKDISDIDIAVYHICVETAILRCLTTPKEPESDDEEGVRANADGAGIAGVGVAGFSGASTGEARTPNENQLNYKPIEAAAKLLFQMVRYAPDKISALNIVLNVIGRVMHGNYQSEYDQRPYFKLFACLLMEFNVLDPVLEPYYVDIYLEVWSALKTLNQFKYFFSFGQAKLKNLGPLCFFCTLLTFCSVQGYLPSIPSVVVSRFHFRLARTYLASHVHAKAPFGG